MVGKIAKFRRYGTTPQVDGLRGQLRYDNFPTTVTEAMAMGCPIVAARTGGIPEQITHEVDGLLCEPGNPDDLADKIGLLLGEPALASRLGARARLNCELSLSPAVISATDGGFL